jgi:hypothetical protein
MNPKRVIIPWHYRTWIPWFIAILVLGYTACRKGIELSFAPPPLPRGIPLLQQGVTLVPESDRPLDFFVMGLNPEKETYFNLPDDLRKRGFTDHELAEVDRNLYWLNFEMSHGLIMKYLPEGCHLFVAVPWPREKQGCSGREETFFREYLSARCGWSEKRVREQIHFFCSPTSLVWAQDVGEILGRDSRNRAIIDVGSTGPTTRYRSAIHTLAKTFPNHFTLKVLPRGINAEGGDEEIVWTPAGKPALMVGRHRVQSFLEDRDQATYENYPVDDLSLAQAREAFSKAFYGLPVMIVPEAALIRPELRSKELFHLDILATILYNQKHVPHAFVPTYDAQVVDAMTEVVMSRAYLEGVQREFDAAAEQFAKTGYQVVRIPFADHPTRSPVNLVKYLDRTSGRVVVLLPRYSYHLPLNTFNPRKRVQQAMTYLDEKALEWHARRDAASYNAYLMAIQNLWREMEETQKMPNPLFERQAALFRKAGYEVIGVPTYAWGSGGLHCQMLR